MKKMKKENKIKTLRKEAKKILKKDKANFVWRSCWNCNSAHGHLKDRDYIINCFNCGHWFYKGIDITEE